MFWHDSRQNFLICRSNQLRNSMQFKQIGLNCAAVSKVFERLIFFPVNFGI